MSEALPPESPETRIIQPEHYHRALEEILARLPDPAEAFSAIAFSRDPGLVRLKETGEFDSLGRRHDQYLDQAGIRPTGAQGDLWQAHVAGFALALLADRRAAELQQQADATYLESQDENPVEPA